MQENVLDDPIWDYVLFTKLQPYLPAVRRWWEEYEHMEVHGTGVFPIKYDDVECPPGLSMRMTTTAVRSPIKNIQAFPFVPSGYLQITGVTGGVNKMIERTCYNNRFKLEEFTIIEKHNLPSTYQSGQWLAFIPSDLLMKSKELGKYVYLNMLELVSLANGKVIKSVELKCARYASSGVEENIKSV